MRKPQCRPEHSVPDYDLYVWARDADHALELVGNGAAEEFESLELAISESDPDERNQDWEVFRVRVEAASPERTKNGQIP